MRRVAILNDIGYLGGIEMMLLLLARRIPRDQFTPIYFAPEPGPMTDQMAALGVEVIPVYRGQWWSTSFYMGRRKVLNPLALLYDLTVIGGYLWKLAAAFRAAKIDVIHSSGVIAPISGGLSARLAGIPHVAQVQDIIANSTLRRVYQFALGHLADQIVAISRVVAVGYPPHKTRVVPNVADLERWQGTTDIRQALGIVPGETLIGIIGRLTPWKGQRVFLAAAQLLVAEQESCRFIIVGDDSVGSIAGYRAELEQQAIQGKLKGRVQFLGRRADVLDVMAACDIVVHASTKPEPFGIVIVEAMAMKKPVIATAIGGPLDIIEDKVDGLLVPPGDAPALAAAIQFLIDHPESASQIAECAQQKSQTRYAASKMVESFTAIYQELTAQQSDQ